MPFNFVIFLIVAVIAALVTVGTVYARGAITRINEKNQTEYEAKVANYQENVAQHGSRYYGREPEREKDMPVPSYGYAGAAVGLAALLFLFTIFTIVPTREVGVVTSFGKPTDELSNGFHFKAPWEEVHHLDGTVQTNNFKGDKCVSIRIGNESTACVDTTIKWRIKLEAGQSLYQDYRDRDGKTAMENIEDSLVTRELNAALNDVLGDFNPLDQITVDTEGAGTDLSEFSTQVEQALTERVGDSIEIDSVLLPLIRFDDSTQKKLNDYQAEVALTRIAEQKQQTAAAQAIANQALAESISNDPNVLVAQCVDALSSMVEKGQQVPIGFSCWPGGSASTVVVPQK